MLIYGQSLFGNRVTEPGGTGPERAARKTHVPVLSVTRDMVAVVCPAMDGPILKNARGYGVGRTGRVPKRRVGVIVEILLHTHIRHLGDLNPSPGHVVVLLADGTPTCSASCVQCVGGSRPVAWAAEASPGSGVGSVAGSSLVPAEVGSVAPAGEAGASGAGEVGSSVC